MKASFVDYKRVTCHSSTVTEITTQVNVKHKLQNKRFYNKQLYLIINIYLHYFTCGHFAVIQLEDI